MTLTGIVRDTRYLEHQPAEGHLENSSRLQAVYAMLEDADMRGRFADIRPRIAGRQEITALHSSAYVDRVAATAGKPLSALTPDTHASAGSWKAARLAVGGVLEAVSAVAAGHTTNAFALVRPPGHHAEKNRAVGFCLFNNVALAAKFALDTLGLERILIVDWDVHHGNGTQHFFETDNRVFFYSMHLFPHFPGTGSFTETGRGKGEGYTMNVALPGGYGDGEYVALFEKLLRPVSLAYRPQLILVSAGFDTHQLDPMGRMRMTSAGFACLARSLMNVAAVCCDGKMVLALEGGYHLKSLTDSVKAVLRELSDQTESRLAPVMAGADPKKLDWALSRCRHVHKHYWHCLR